MLHLLRPDVAKVTSGRSKRYVIYKHKIYLFQAYYLQRINRISY